MKHQTLKQRRSLAAKRGWETRHRRKALAAAWDDLAERAKTAPIIADIDRAHREREAQSKHPGSPTGVTTFNFEPSATKTGTTCPKCGKWAPMRWEPETQTIVPVCPCSAPSNDHREYAPELLLTEGMRVKPFDGYWPTQYPEPLMTAIEYPTKPSISARIRVLVARFVKTLRRKA